MVQTGCTTGRGEQPHSQLPVVYAKHLNTLGPSRLFPILSGLKQNT